MRKRQIVAAIITAVVVLAVWKYIDWSTQPPPPHVTKPATAAP